MRLKTQLNADVKLATLTLSSFFMITTQNGAPNTSSSMVRIICKMHVNWVYDECFDSNPQANQFIQIDSFRFFASSLINVSRERLHSCIIFSYQNKAHYQSVCVVCVVISLLCLSYPPWLTGADGSSHLRSLMQCVCVCGRCGCWPDGLCEEPTEHRCIIH